MSASCRCGRTGGYRIGIFKIIGYGFIGVLFLTIIGVIIEGVVNSRDSELSQLLMAVLFTATSLSIFFVSLDHFKKTKQDKKAKRSFFVMIAVALFFLVLASIEAIPLL